MRRKHALGYALTTTQWLDSDAYVNRYGNDEVGSEGLELSGPSDTGMVLKPMSDGIALHEAR